MIHLRYLQKEESVEIKLVNIKNQLIGLICDSTSS